MNPRNERYKAVKIVLEIINQSSVINRVDLSLSDTDFTWNDFDNAIELLEADLYTWRNSQEL